MNMNGEVAQQRRVKRMALVLALFAFALYLAFIVYAVHRA
jgi:hypothetical protein